jgi:hypothetical protein
MDVDLRQLPDGRAHLLLLQGKRAFLFQSSQQTPAEGHIVEKVTLDFTDSVLLVVHHQVAGHAGEHPRFSRRRVKGGCRVKMQ